MCWVLLVHGAGSATAPIPTASTGACTDPGAPVHGEPDAVHTHGPCTDPGAPVHGKRDAVHTHRCTAPAELQGSGFKAIPVWQNLRNTYN